MRQFILLAALVPAVVCAQQNSEGAVLEARRVSPTIPLKIYNPAGSVRVVGWDYDSVVVRARVRPTGFFFGTAPTAVKFGVDEFRFGVEEPRGADTARTAALTVYVPKHSQIFVKTASATIDGTDVSGTFYSASGNIQLRGASSNLDVETMTGSVDVNANASWLRARTSSGRLLVRGGVQDVDATTVDGAIDLATSSVYRGRFQSVSGDIRFLGTPLTGSLYEFSNHSGAVDFVLSRNTSGIFELSSVSGPIENGFNGVQPVAAGPHSMRLNLGRGESNITVRTFKGPIRLRPQP